ncbi:cytochrome D ubiquinol oxidase subunit II [Laceyella sacchari]|jgi:cytochrome d ubiquinol oxidase subunit II|uniref:Cytochrome bd-I ubiquinol oxidase subunit 2 apoprotein n=3 Tax=Laceyella TaxID=292635 RepID=A0AA46AEB4_9BACL|nr:MULTISPECIES: cytochrome d ubiquinol oxidase subunit II [Laceyella]AUS09401.1 cytochrome D ubiquinol oxidase subunit II [Laceyella sacchari]MRG29260.1 cytochrome d ubiquinol oxidase subunit II [Laceyella tengchongensis]PRZ17044.1 cytochrome bd-I ubiquinol oxidase subunit 2 apoprotein [Laceyella sediminis]TCW37620.1 cytochrome bd-I ubiquinol oxidase subunit 2 apoprotein [Laceyella sacchari]UWE02773.1 cytochrome d ubiquinol oxidase subunit II [Laceyella sacchari]
MKLEIIGITVLWVFLYGYLIVASIDFGAGFFSYYSMLTKKDHIINNIISRYLSPVWEVTNVFLIFFVVGCVGFFPDTAYYYGTALLIPGSIALILLTIRGSFYAFANYGARQSRVYMFLYGMTGLFIPASLSTVLTISEGGFIEKVGTEVVFHADRLLTSPYSWSVVFLALVSILYISASFLTFYADRAGDTAARELLRKYTLFWSGPTILASLLVFWSLSKHNPVHFENALSIGWMFGASFLCFCVAVYLMWKRQNLGIQFIFVMFQFAYAFFGYGMSHMPYLLYDYVTISSALTNSTMGWALVGAFIAGLFLLIPSIALLMWLFLFNAKYVRGEK